MSQKGKPLRLRMKTFTDKDGKMYLASMGYIGLSTGRMIAYAMSDEKTFQLDLSIEEWNNLPYHYFKEDGEAPRPERKWPYDSMSTSPIVPG